MSAIFYRFKSQRQDSRLPIDGTGISVFDLKKEIILANQMGDGKEFDLGLYDASGEEYTDDSFIVPRSTTVVVRRLPPARAGRGTAAMYVAGTSALEHMRPSGPLGAMGPSKARLAMPVRSITKRFDGKGEDDAPLYPTIQAGPSVGGEDEAAKIAAMFQAEADQWQQTQETMATATPVYSVRGGMGRGGARGGGNMGREGGGAGGGGGGDRSHHTRDLVAEFSDKPLPPGYICYRCGQRGHWIQLCPTNDDKEFDNKPRFKRTTGIPRSFLKTVDGPVPSDGPMGGVMITPEGGFVIAQPDMATWEKARERSKPKLVTEAEVRESAPSDASLACPICARLFTQAVKTPRDGTTFCEECIQTHLLEHDFTCPPSTAAEGDGAEGPEKIGSLDKLEEDWDARARVDAYIAKEIERRKYDTDAEATEDAADGADPTAASSAPKAAGAKAGGPTAGQPKPQAAPAVREQTKDPGVLMAQLAQLRMMQKLPNLPEQARAKVDLAYHEVASQLHYLQLAHAMSMQPQFNAFGQPQPFNPATMLPPPPTFTYGGASPAGGAGGQAEEKGGAALTEEDKRRRLANGRRHVGKRAAPEGEPTAAGEPAAKAQKA